MSNTVILCPIREADTLVGNISMEFQPAKRNTIKIKSVTLHHRREVQQIVSDLEAIFDITMGTWGLTESSQQKLTQAIEKDVRPRHSVNPGTVIRQISVGLKSQKPGKTE